MATLCCHGSIDETFLAGLHQFSVVNIGGDRISVKNFILFIFPQESAIQHRKWLIISQYVHEISKSKSNRKKNLSKILFIATFMIVFDLQKLTFSLKNFE